MGAPEGFRMAATAVAGATVATDTTADCTAAEKVGSLRSDNTAAEALKTPIDILRSRHRWRAKR